MIIELGEDEPSNHALPELLWKVEQLNHVTAV